MNVTFNVDSRITINSVFVMDYTGLDNEGVKKLNKDIQGEIEKFILDLLNGENDKKLIYLIKDKFDRIIDVKKNSEYEQVTDINFECY